MTIVMIHQAEQITKLADGSTPTILIIRTYDKKGEWMIEALFEGGNKVTGVATTEFVNSFESDLFDQGWQIDASLFSRGFNAKPPQVEELIFASSAGMWPDDYAVESWL